MRRLTAIATGEGTGNWTTTPVHDTTPDTTNPFSLNDLILTIILCSVFGIVLVIAGLAIRVTRCRNSGKTNRHRNNSDRDELYQNSNVIERRRIRFPLETVVNRPLPVPPVEIENLALPHAVPEDDYLRPRDIPWNKHLEEIANLPPAPPVFPSDFESLQLDGDGAYTQVIKDDEAPLLSPGPMHETTSDGQQCEPHEESGYVVPKSLRETSVQQSLSETDRPPEPNEIQHMDSGNQRRERTVVTTHGAVQQCPDMSRSVLFAEGASVSSATLIKTQRPNETKGKIYRSTCQLYLSPATQHRNPEVSTSKPTVVVYIHTNP